MDGYLWSLLLGGIAGVLLAFDGRPAPDPAPCSARLEHLIELHRSASYPARLIPVVTPGRGATDCTAPRAQVKG